MSDNLFKLFFSFCYTEVVMIRKAVKVMAKRKKKKETKKGFAHATELYGVLLVLAAILGIGRYGPVGNMIASFAIFLVGGLYVPLLVVFLVLGAYLIINRECLTYLQLRC